MPVMQMRPSYPMTWEESITRRGQYVLWYAASACYCVSDNGRVNPNCPRCFGKGFVYSPVTSARKIIWTSTDGRKTIDLSSVLQALDSKIKTVYKAYIGVRDEIVLLSYTTTTITPVRQIPKGVRLTLDYEEDLTEQYQGPATYVGANIVEVPIRLMHNQNYFAGMLVAVRTLYNVTKGRTIPVVATWANKILVNDTCDEIDDITVDCTYVKARKFLITSVNPKTRLQDNLFSQQADAMMTFPGTYHVGRGDVVVLQLAEIRETMVGYNEGLSFVLPFQSVSRILRIEDAQGEITDYTLVRDNEIRWGSRVPTRFSCVFMYHPAFSVLDDLPPLRYSEDKIWPKRVYLKKFTTFTHPSRVLSLASVQSAGDGLLGDTRALVEGGMI